MCPWERVLVVLVLANQCASWLDVEIRPVNASTERPIISEFPVTVSDSRSDRAFVRIGENLNVTDAFLVNHRYNQGGTRYGDNRIVADWLYDAVERRQFLRTLSVRDVEDSADIRCGRAPGVYPNEVDWNAPLSPWTIVCNIGFESWASGFGAYFAAVRGAVLDRGRGMLYLSSVPSVPGITRHGQEYKADRLIDHVALTPEGTLIVGFDTDPAQKPQYSAIVHGDMLVDGVVFASRCIEGRPPEAPWPY